jgi:hypothetical protein
MGTDGKVEGCVAICWLPVLVLRRAGGSKDAGAVKLRPHENEKKVCSEAYFPGNQLT